MASIQANFVLSNGVGVTLPPGMDSRILSRDGLVERRYLNNTGVMKILFSVATTIGWSLVCLGKRHISTPQQ